MLKRSLKCVVAILVAAAVTGCSLSPNLKGIKYSEQIGVGTQKVEDREISMKRFQASLTQGSGVNDVRLVEIFRREGQKFPQYHLFDIRKGSPYELLGLENGDVLLAANDYVVFEPAGFRAYVVDFLRTQKEGSITISRGGVSILYRYKLIA